ncbi:MAG TPA: plastocyanin/azurin family copper-binding protein, partial [Gemmatimonadota bacterium]|nr:plastocyanin/azurin family copper-binding protein [Gemmatimonadota bacterium]
MRSPLIAIALAAALLGGCKDVGGPAAPDVAPPTSGEAPPGGGPGGAAAPRAVQVEIESFEFRGPGGSSAVSVAVGDTLVFVNRDAAPHTATSTSVPAGAIAFDTGRLDQGQSARVVVTAAGTYAYRCDFHPAMTGTVAATPASGGTPPPGG